MIEANAMSELLNLVGLSTGVVLYAMLLAMVIQAGRAPGGHTRFDPLAPRQSHTDREHVVVAVPTTRLLEHIADVEVGLALALGIQEGARLGERKLAPILKQFQTRSPREATSSLGRGDSTSTTMPREERC